MIYDATRLIAGLLFPMSVYALELKLTSIHLVTHLGNVAFTSDNPCRDYSGTAYCQVANPFCRD